MADPVKYTDADGNEVELPPLEEIETLKTKASKVEEYETLIKEKEGELEKLKNKDVNFSKLRDKTEEEKAKLLEKSSGEKKMLLEEVLELRKERDQEKKTRFEQERDNLLQGLAGDDEKLRANIEARAKQWGPINTVEEMKQRYSDAYTLEKAGQPAVRQFNSYFPSSSHQGSTAAKRFTDTEGGKASFATWFPSIAPKIYKDKQA